MNLSTFSGRLVRDAELKTLPTTTILNFTLAVDCGFGDKKRTEFISCKAFKKDAIAPYLTKGKPVLVHGEYQEEKWEKDGVKHSRPGWIVNHIEFQQGDKGEAAPMQPAGKTRKEYDADDMGDAPF